MIAWWFLAGSLALGWWVVTLLPFKRKWWLTASLAVIVGFLLTMWVSFALAYALGNTEIGLSLTNIFLIWPVGLAARALWVRRKDFDLLMARAAALLLACVGTFILFALHAGYRNTAGGLSAPGYTWGDLPLHMTLASYFAHTTRPVLELPLLANTSLSYPFLVDWHAGLLVRMGASWVVAIGIPSALLCAAGLTLSFELVRRLLGSARGAGMHLVLFLGLGSAAGIVPLVTDFFTGKAIWAMDYSNTPLQGLALANPVTSHFFPQRTFLFGFALLMGLIFIAVELHRQKEWRALVIPGMLLGLLPFVHAHTAVVGMLWFGGVACWTLVTEKESRFWVGASLVLMGVIALPQLWWQLHAPSVSAGAIQIGWMVRDGESVVTFWTRQLGILIPLMAFGGYLVRDKLREPFLGVAYLGAIFFFVVGNLYQFHPSLFDNLKFMLYSLWVLLIPAAWLLDGISRTKVRLFVPIFIGLSTLVGLHAIVRDFIPTTHYELFSKEDLLAADDLQDILPANAVVATVERHNNTIAALVGRRVVAGYSGWLWSYGLTYIPAIDAQKKIVSGLDDGSLAREFGVTHIAVHRRDVVEGLADFEKLRETYRSVYSGHDWAVFSVDRSN